LSAEGNATRPSQSFFRQGAAEPAEHILKKVQNALTGRVQEALVQILDEAVFSRACPFG
jgi:hypothetical protein